jgi:Arc/MetJ family transcription regulator
MYALLMSTHARQNVQRTTLDLDVDELERARAVLGTSTKRETVNQALREVNRMAALRRAAAIVRSGQLGVPDPEELAELRRPRFEPS